MIQISQDEDYIGATLFTTGVLLQLHPVLFITSLCFSSHICFMYNIVCDLNVPSVNRNCLQRVKFHLIYQLTESKMNQMAPSQANHFFLTQIAFAITKLAVDFILLL